MGHYSIFPSITSYERPGEKDAFFCAEEAPNVGPGGNKDEVGRFIVTLFAPFVVVDCGYASKNDKACFGEEL